MQPKHPFGATNGPVPENPREKERCKAARKMITNVDWDCDVKKLYRQKDLGCKIAMSNAITWFFENVEEGIILEEDCLKEVTSK